MSQSWKNFSIFIKNDQAFEIHPNQAAGSPKDLLVKAQINPQEQDQKKKSQATVLNFWNIQNENVNNIKTHILRTPKYKLV